MRGQVADIFAYASADAFADVFSDVYADSFADTERRRCKRQGCKIRSGRDRIIRIIAIGILSEIMKILLASCWNSSEIQKFDEFSTFYTEFGAIPRKIHQNLCKI